MSIYGIIDYRAEKQAINNLKNNVDKIILSNPLDVHNSICGHPDLAVCKISDNTVIVCPSQYDYYKNHLPDINVICGRSEPSGKYPNDIFYNAACFKDAAIHNFDFTDEITLSVIKQKFSKHINVRQGYSKCSICLLDFNKFITDDEGIYEKLILNGFEGIFISKGDIKLKEMNYGFFGGATGLYNNKLFLNGELRYHKDFQKINSFLNKHNIELIEIKKGCIEDIGSIIILSS